MADRRGRPNLPAPTTLAEVEWSPNSRAWHALSKASASRWGRTLCGSTVIGAIYAYEAQEFPQGPHPDHRPICSRCVDRASRLAAGAPTEEAPR